VKKKVENVGGPERSRYRMGKKKSRCSHICGEKKGGWEIRFSKKQELSLGGETSKKGSGVCRKKGVARCGFLKRGWITKHQPFDVGGGREK